MSEVRVSERRGLDTGEAADGRSDAPMDMAMEVATAVTSIAALEPMERNQNGKRRRSEVPATAWALGDWTSRMERAAQQEAREIAQLHRTIAKMANMLETHTALQEAQWRGMKSWLEEKEKKRDAYHQDDLLWGEGITDMVARAVAATERGQKEERRADTEGVGLEASIHADLTQTGGPEKTEERHQLQPGRQLKSMPTPKPKPKPNPNPSPKPNPAPAPAPAPRPAPTPTPRATSALRGATSAPTPTPTRRWETVPPRNLKKPASPGPAPTTGSSIADRRLILRRDETVPLPNKMDQEIASAINRALFHQQAPAHIRIINARRNAKGVIMAITHQNGTAEMAMQYRDIIMTAARTVGRRVVDVEENETWERLKIHAVPLMRYMGKGTEGLQKMREEFEAENEGIAIPTQVRWLANPRTITERKQNGEFAASSVVFVVKGSRLVQSLIKKGIKAAGVWYRVEAFMNAGPDSRCEHCCGWGHIDNKCGSKPKCGYCSGNHRTSDHKCNVVGCMAKQGSLCGHTLEKCPNCKRNHIAFSSRCAKKSEAAKAARQSRKRGTAGRAPTSDAMHTAIGTNRVVLGRRPTGGAAADRGSEEEEMADVQGEEATGEARDVVMTETETATTAATATETETQTEAGVLATNEYSDPA
jgi:hypothetical protein